MKSRDNHFVLWRTKFIGSFINSRLFAIGLVNSLVVSFERKGSASIAMIPSIMICRGREEGNKEIYRNIETEQKREKDIQTGFGSLK